jgi:hypothetical protein
LFLLPVRHSSVELHSAMFSWLLYNAFMLRLFKVAGRKHGDAIELKPWKKYGCICTFFSKKIKGRSLLL